MGEVSSRMQVAHGLGADVEGDTASTEVSTEEEEASMVEEANRVQEVH